MVVKKAPFQKAHLRNNRSTILSLLCHRISLRFSQKKIFSLKKESLLKRIHSQSVFLSLFQNSSYFLPAQRLLIWSRKKGGEKKLVLCHISKVEKCTERTGYYTTRSNKSTNKTALEWDPPSRFVLRLEKDTQCPSHEPTTKFL